MGEEKTQSGIFHIHIDARYISPDLASHVTSHLGFYNHHFSGHPEGYQHFEPNFHLTRKLPTKNEFTQAWGVLEQAIEASNFVGYIEGEYIPLDEALPELPYDNSIPFPFKVERRKLLLDEGFRQTEFHVVMDGDRSDERLIKKLLDVGLYGAYLDKTDYRAIVLTMQGYRKDIDLLIPSIRNYLHQAGGAVNGTLKEERAIRHRLYGITPADLPEIADRVMFF